MGKGFHQTINKIKMRGGSFNYAQETKKTYPHCMNRYCLLFFLLCSLYGWSQDSLSNRRVKRLLVQDTVVVDSLSINPSFLNWWIQRGIPYQRIGMKLIMPTGLCIF